MTNDQPQRNADPAIFAAQAHEYLDELLPWVQSQMPGDSSVTRKCQKIGDQIDAFATALCALSNAAERGAQAVSEFAARAKASLAEEERDRQQFISDIQKHLQE